ncbi:MAG TPA: LysR family transcriptional regulator [Desulfomonilaceae bacterium]|nr:LysR family transcriptional regulator [Desulfomonilaceae bacterium]
MPFKLRCKVWLENDRGQPIIGEGRLRILCALRRTGSISKAARKLNLPFRNVWAKIKDAERQAGFKIVSTTGSGSKLTAEGEELLSLFARLQSSCHRSARTKFRQVFCSGDGKPRSTDGRLDAERTPHAHTEQ